MHAKRRPAIGSLLYFALALTLSVYFTFAAVQGDFGVFKRAEVDAEAKALATELALLKAEVAEMENLTLRLSDQYLDLDLLDEQAREILGLIRGDEIVIR